MTLVISLTEILRGSVSASIFGVFLAFLYDGVRLLRMLCGVSYTGAFIKGPFFRLAKEKREKIAAFRDKQKAYRVFLSALQFLTDFLFFSFFGVTYSIFLYYVNHGIFRFAFLLATGLGFFLYRQTVGRLVFLLLEELSSFFLLFIFLVAKIVGFPLKICYYYIFNKIFGVFLLLFRKVCAIIKEKKNIRDEIKRNRKKEAMQKAKAANSSPKPNGGTTSTPVKASYPKKRATDMSSNLDAKAS